MYIIYYFDGDGQTWMIFWSNFFFFFNIGINKIIRAPPPPGPSRKVICP